MQCISINYKHADISVRECFAFSTECQRELLRQLCAEEGRQCVLLCTCNRTEVYFCGIPEEEILSALSVQSGISVQEMLPVLRSYSDERAVLHLFRVAGGLHSMVLGEDEILRQTKAAYQTACECGAAGYELHQTFQAAITCAKRIKTETPMSVTSVSVATLAANEAARSGGNVLVIGAAGQIGTTTVRNLLSHKHVEVTATLRSHGGTLQLADARIRTADYTDRYRLIAEADCVISATSSPHYTVTLHGLRQVPRRPHLLFIDLAVPPDIDPAVTSLEGVQRLGIDDFERLAAENNALKTDSKEAAGIIIAEEAENLQKALAFHDFLPDAERVYEAVRRRPEQLLYRLRAELDARSFSEVLRILEGL